MSLLYTSNKEQMSFKHLVLKIKKNMPNFLCWLFFLFLIIIFHCNHTLNADDGLILNGAWNLINKKILYVDSFEMIPPASFYLNYWGFKLFGVHYMTAKIISMVFLLLGAIGVYKIVNKIQKNKLNIITPLLFILLSSCWVIINHNLYNIVSIIWATYFFAIGIEKKSTILFILSGLISGLSVLFLQQKGLVFIIVSTLFLIILTLKTKNWPRKTLAYIGFSILPMLTLLLKWPFKLLYESLIIFPLFNYIEVNKTSYIFFFVFLFIFILTSLTLLNKKNKTINYLLFVQFFFLLTTIPLPDHYHITLISFPLLILLPVIIGSSKKTKTLFFVKIYLAIGFLSFFLLSLSLLGTPPFYFYKNDKSPNNIIEYIKNECEGDYLFAGPFSPEIYFETKKINASSYSVLIQKQQTKEQFRAVLEQLKINQAGCAILIYYPNIKNKFKHDGNNIVENYIKEAYTLEKEDRFYSIYKK